MIVRRYRIISANGTNVVYHGKTAHEAFLNSGLPGGFNSYTYELVDEFTTKPRKRSKTALWGRNQRKSK